MLTTISMFDQIKAEPLHFYQSSSCPPQLTINPQHQLSSVLQANQVRIQPQTAVVAINDDKDNLQTNLHTDHIMPTLVGHIKSEILSPMPQQVLNQTQVGSTTTQTSSTSSRGSKPQACKVCGKVLSSASSYYVHMKLHSGTKPFQCSVCEAAFCRKPYLEVHMRTHTGERPFGCDICLKRFSQKSSLNTHKRIHSDHIQDRPFQCSQCPSAFSRRPYLDIHMRTHTGERPFQCDICLKRFSQKSSLNIHKTIHSGKPYLDIHLRTHTGEKPFECDLCLKKFSQRSTLNIHKRIHTGVKPYACDICNKTFSVKSYVTAHRWSHVSEKPLSCERCEMSFTSKSQFAIHIRVHSSAGQNFECNLCGRTFIRDSYLIRHHNRVHRDRVQTSNITATINSVVEQSAATCSLNETSNVFDNNEQIGDLSRYVSNLAASAVRQQGRIIQRNLQQPSLVIPAQILQDSKENIQLQTIVLSNGDH